MEDQRHMILSQLLTPDARERRMCMASRDTMLNRQRDIDAMIRDMMQYREFDLSNQRMHEQWRM
jgi:hypothetical protein